MRLELLLSPLCAMLSLQLSSHGDCLCKRAAQLQMHHTGCCCVCLSEYLHSCSGSPWSVQLKDTPCSDGNSLYIAAEHEDELQTALAPLTGVTHLVRTLHCWRIIAACQQYAPCIACMLADCIACRL